MTIGDHMRAVVLSCNASASCYLTLTLQRKDISGLNWNIFAFLHYTFALEQREDFCSELSTNYISDLSSFGIHMYLKLWPQWGHLDCGELKHSPPFSNWQIYFMSVVSIEYTTKVSVTTTHRISFSTVHMKRMSPFFLLCHSMAGVQIHTN